MKICQIFIVSIFLIVMHWSIVGAQMPCGLYEPDDKAGPNYSFNFGDNMQVKVTEVELFDTTYSIKNNEIFVDIGLRLEIVDDNTLKGVCNMTLGKIYKRVKKPSGSCKNDPAIIEVQNCYKKAVALRRSGKLEEAIKKYKKCCDAGSPLSCNEYAVMKQLLDGDTKTALIYYKKACDEGIGDACGNLALNAFMTGQDDAGMKLLKEACDKGHTSSCIKLYQINNKKTK